MARHICCTQTEAVAKRTTEWTSPWGKFKTEFCFPLEFVHWRERLQLCLLLGADNAGDHLVFGERRARQTAAPSNGVVEQSAVKTTFEADVIRTSVQTQILAGRGMGKVPCGQMARVLGRPARGTGEGGGHHDGGGLRNLTHRAGNVKVLMTALVNSILGSVDEGEGFRFGHGIKLWSLGQTQGVAGSATVGEVRSSHHPCVD